MAFTANLQRHVSCPPAEVAAGTLRDVLEATFASNEKARRYVLDDQGAIRHHMVVFVNGAQIVDRTTLSDVVPDGAEVWVMQALSGG